MNSYRDRAPEKDVGDEIGSKLPGERSPVPTKSIPFGVRHARPFSRGRSMKAKNRRWWALLTRARCSWRACTNLATSIAAGQHKREVQQNLEVVKVMVMA